MAIGSDSDYEAQESLQRLIFDTLESVDQKQKKGRVGFIDRRAGHRICVKSLLAATLFIVVISGITSLAVVSTYCAVVAPHKFDLYN